MPPLTRTTSPRVRRRGRPYIAWAAFGLLATSALGYACQLAATKRDRRRFPAPGRLVDIGGLGLHLDVAGDDRGKPTVVLEAGLGSFSPNWHWVQLALADELRVVSYDRAGLGWSDPSPEPRDAHTMAVELHTALHLAGITGPYVLAGHSFGGLVVRAFADAYRPEVAGLVLVDASHPDQWARWPVPYAHRLQVLSLTVMAALARVGLFRVANPFGAVSAGLPAQQVAELNAHFAVPQTSSVEAEQMREWERTTRPLLHRAAPLEDLPLAVIGVGVQPLGAETLDALQQELPGLSTNSARRVIADATHESLIAERGNATRVVDAILAVVDAADGERVETAWSAREAHRSSRDRADTAIAR